MIGLRLHNYEVVSLLGEGGMGQVYLARHVFMGRRAAIKFLRPELIADPTVVARFLDESRATNAIGHPGIIDIMDVGLLSDGRTPYLMMEFLGGESLSACLGRSRPLPIHQAVEIACQTASALEAAHARQIVHRDLKPDNLFLVPDEALATKIRVKILDFGIAKLRGDMRGADLRTRTGAIMGTAQYMSPEQCLGRPNDIDPRTDIYALGIILYEMLCGQVPFTGEGLGEILLHHMSTPPPPLRDRVPEIPESLERAVLRALTKEPNQRFQSMADFALAVREYDPRAALTAHVGRLPGERTPQVAPTVMIPDGTPPPILTGHTPMPVRVPASITPPPAVPYAPASPATMRVPTAMLDERPPIAPAAEPSCVPRAGAVGAHTTLSAHTGQMLAAKDYPARLRSRRGLLAASAIAAAAVIALGAVALLRGGGAKSVARPVPAAAAPEKVPVPVPALAQPPAPAEDRSPPAAMPAPPSKPSAAATPAPVARKKRSTGPRKPPGEQPW
jgi:eukaryotic-like serine/threonine-protein kinase